MTSTKVLVVDDDQDTADSLAALIDALGYETEVAYGGTEAVAACERCAPELAILDIRMPRVDGREAARLLRGLDRPPRAIVSFTGAVAPEDGHSSERLFDGRLSKPPRLGELRALLARTCA